MPDGTLDIEGQIPIEASASPALPKTGRRASKKKAGKHRVVKSNSGEKRSHAQSTIAFPYHDLDSAVAMAQAMIGNGGGVALSRDQLAGVTGLSARSGNFVLKLATARLFGLVTINQGKYQLTNLGFEVVNSDERVRRAARARAFLTVPLYQRVYEEFRGKQLPPRPHGLEQALVRFGVVLKQRAPARLAFDKSAKQAGFFDNGNDRLVEPIIAVGAPTVDHARPFVAPIEANPHDKSPGASRRPENDERDLHPFIQGLLDTLPEPETNWAIEGRSKWLQTAANIFDLIYKGDGSITVTAKKSASDEG
jgi:hypothetical protein